MIFQVIRTSTARKPYIFVIFQGGGGRPDPISPLWIRPCWLKNIFKKSQYTNTLGKLIFDILFPIAQI